MTLPNLTQSTRDWTSVQRRRAALICLIAGFSIAFALGSQLMNFFLQPDVAFYLNLAQGQPAMLPFASRQLGPLIVRGLVHVLGISIYSGFIVEGAIAMLVFFPTVLWFLLRSGTPRFMIAATVGLLFWGWQFNSLAVPDLLYSALLCIFLLLLSRQHFFLAALMMLPLTVSRESTLLTLACFLIAGWRRLRISEALLAVAATLGGILIVKHLTASALPNQENLPPIVYLIAKMPWNFFKNFTGIYPWSNVYPECDTPVWQMPLHFGPVKAIGTCGFRSDAPLQLLFYGLASFGLFPLLFLALRRLHKPLALTPIPPREQLLIRFCVIYGVIGFALAGLLGESFQRLFAYSWPVFLVALPILMTKTRANIISNRAAIAFLSIHLTISWLALRRYHPQLIPFEIVLWIAGFLLLRRTLSASGGMPESTTEVNRVSHPV